MNRILPFCLGVGTVSWFYGDLREDIFRQQRTIRTKLLAASPEDDSPTRQAILSDMENQRRTLFQIIGDEWNHSVVDVYQILVGSRPK